MIPVAERTLAVSVIVPLYNEEASLAELAEGIRRHLPTPAYEILFVDDGSTDGSFAVVQREAASDPHTRFLRFGRNRGKTSALAAGFAIARGRVVVTMDADLQDDPAELPRMLAELDNGCDLVCGWKARRQDPWHKTIPSRAYNAIIGRVFNLDLHDVNTGFKAMRAEVTQNLPLYGEMHRMVAVVAAEQGFRVREIPVQHHPRRFGRSKYGFERYLRGALDVMAVWFLTRYGEAPGHFFGALGALALLFAILCAVLAPLLGLLLQSGLTAFLLFGLALAAGLWGTLMLAIGLTTEMMLRLSVPRDPLEPVAERSPETDAPLANVTHDT